MRNTITDPGVEGHDLSMLGASTHIQVIESGVFANDLDFLRCRTLGHDVCGVDTDGRHHTFDRWHPDRGVAITPENL